MRGDLVHVSSSWPRRLSPLTRQASPLHELNTLTAGGPTSLGPQRRRSSKVTCLRSSTPSVHSARCQWFARIVTFDMSTVVTWPVALVTAKLVELPGQDHIPFSGDTDQLLDEVEEFLTGVRPLLSTSVFFLPSYSLTSSAQLSDYQNWGITAGSRSIEDHHAIVRKIPRGIPWQGDRLQPATDFLATLTVRPEPSNPRVRSGTR